MIVDEPARGGYFVPRVLGLAGRDQLAEAIAGRLVPPPVHHLTGLAPTAVGSGTAEFRMPASPWLASPFGPVPGGMLAVLADGPLGGAVQSTLPPWVHFTTSELSLSYLRPGLPDGRMLTSRGRLIHAGRTLALSDAVVEDAAGRQLAHGTSRCFVFPPADPGPAPPAETGDPLAYDTPDPWRRPVEGEVPGPDRLAPLSGLEQWRAWVAGDLPAPPVARLTGSRPVLAEEGRVDVAMPATAWHCSPTGFVQGGLLAYLADCAVTAAAATLAPAGTAYAPVDLTVKFLRPVPPDGRLLVAAGRVRHTGRRLVVAAADLVNADGKLVVTALGSVLLLAGATGAGPAGLAVEGAGS